MDKTTYADLSFKRQTVNKDPCFDASELKYEITRQQHEASAWKSASYRKIAKDVHRPFELDASEKRKCPVLYKIAREMLNGLKVKLPSETNKTLWKFRERIRLSKLRDTNLRWNYPWDSSNSVKTQKLFLRYNVSAKTIKKRKLFLTYGHNCCNSSKVRAVENAISNGKLDIAEALDLSALSMSFQISHQKQLRMRKGAGYWLWKAYIILEALVYKLNDGDLLIYHDAGMYLIDDVGPLLKLCEDVKPSILTFSLGYPERKYSKRDAFVLMGMDDPIVYAAGQAQRLANLIVAMKNCESMQYFMEYLAYTMDLRISGDQPNVMGKADFDNFVGNRHDQTVHSLLSKKWGILEVRDPCACRRNSFEKRGGYASGPYKVLYVQDRNRS